MIFQTGVPMIQQLNQFRGIPCFRKNVLQHLNFLSVGHGFGTNKLPGKKAEIKGSGIQQELTASGGGQQIAHFRLVHLLKKIPHHILTAICKLNQGMEMECKW